MKRLASDLTVADAMRRAAPSEPAPAFWGTAALRAPVSDHPARCAGMLGGKHHLARALEARALRGGDARP